MSARAALDLDSSLPALAERYRLMVAGVEAEGEARARQKFARECLADGLTDEEVERALCLVAGAGVYRARVIVQVVRSIRAGMN